MDGRRDRGYRHIVAGVVVELVVLAVLGAVLWAVAEAATIASQHENSQIKLQTASSRLRLADQDASDALERYDEFSQAKVDVLAWYILKENPTDDLFAALAPDWSLEGMYLVDADGTVIRSTGVPVVVDDGQWSALVDSCVPVQANNLRLYASKVGDGTTLVGARESSDDLADIYDPQNLATLLSPIVVGETGFIVAIDDAVGTVAYAPDEGVVGMLAGQVFSKALPADFKGFVDYRGERCYVECTAADGYIVAAVLPARELDDFCVRSVAVPLTVFAVVCTLVMCYAQFLYADRLRRKCEDPAAADPGMMIKVGKNHGVDASLGKTALSAMLVGSLLAFAITWYVQALVSLSVEMAHDQGTLEHISDTLDTAQERAAELSQLYADDYVERAANIAHLLASDTSLINHDDLETLARKAQLESLYVFDKTGATVATSARTTLYHLPSDEADPSFGFWDVVNDEKDSYVHEIQTDDAGVVFFAGVKRTDAPGMVEAGVSSERVAERMESTDLMFQLGRIPVGNGGSLAAVDGQTGLIAFFPDEHAVGSDPATRGIEPVALVDGYLGYQTIDGVDCLVTTRLVRGTYVMVCVPQSAIGRDDLGLALVTALLCLVLLVPVIASVVIERRDAHAGEGGEGAVPYGGDFKAQPRGIIDLVNPRGAHRRVESIAGRWDDEVHVPWPQKSPGARLALLVRAVLLAAIIIDLVYVYALGGRDQSNALSFIMSQRWEHEPNIFSLSYLGIVVMGAIVCLWLVRLALSASFYRVSARLETLTRLFNSFVKYAVAIGVVFYGLYLVGVDSASLAASAGILTLVVGLGAQSIIKDVLAGIFIVFEGSFRVGDIVTAGTWTGTVLEIGIRTTKIEDGAHNIKVFSNSSIGDIVNMTKKYSYAVVDLAVSFDTPLERLEAMFKRELPLVQKNLPSVVAGPYYKGVVAVGTSALTVRVIAQCREGDRNQLVRDLTRQLLLVCDHNDVAPYKGSCEDSVSTPAATPEERAAAAEFVQEQGALAKDVNVDEKASGV